MSCYVCGAEKESVEHAPARCFFPKNKRKNLITVDSCTEHNEDTSKDDEYVRNIIAMAISNNDVAHQHFLNKCVKSFENSTGLLKETTDIKKRVYVRDTESKNKELKPTYAFQIDRERIDRVLKKIGYAIFYKKYGVRWERELFTASEHLRTEEIKADELGLIIQESQEKVDKLKFEGANPKVFKYSFLEPEEENIHNNILITIFYEGFEVWIIAEPNTSGPKI